MYLSTLRRWWQRNAAYARWKIGHPLGAFRDYYVQQAERRIEDGEVHVSLGARSAATADHQETGRRLFERLLRAGLRPGDRLVDYGCGSLRVGRYLIEHLGEGAYLGMDLTERFYREGLATLDADLVARKRPRFELITDGSVARHSAAPPDVLVSIGVLIHVPRPELDEYLERVAGLIGPSTRGFVSFFGSDAYRRVSNLSWSYPEGELVAACAARGLAARVEPLVELAPPAEPGHRKMMLELGR